MADPHDATAHTLTTHTHTHAATTGQTADQHHTEIHTPAKHDAVGCLVKKTASQSIPASTGTQVTFDTEEFDTDALHDNTTNNTRITIPSGMGGKWLIGYAVEWAQPAAAARRLSEIRKNGTLYYARFEVTVTGDLAAAQMSFFNAVAGDYFELAIFHTNATAINVGPDRTEFWASYMGV